MGRIFFGVPEQFVLFLKTNFNVDTFVETGTYLGETAYWASQHFAKVITIEASKKLRDNAAERYGDQKNVEFRLGDSPEILTDVVQQLLSPAIFWLDAHWCGGQTFGQQNECPLLEELLSLRASSYPHVILIDDARLFLQPPPSPHNIEEWPTIREVIHTLETIDDQYYIIVWNDVIIALPLVYKQLAVDYFRLSQIPETPKIAPKLSQILWRFRTRN